MTRDSTTVRPHLRAAVRRLGYACRKGTRVHARDIGLLWRAATGHDDDDDDDRGHKSGTQEQHSFKFSQDSVHISGPGSAPYVSGPGGVPAVSTQYLEAGEEAAPDTRMFYAGSLTNRGVQQNGYMDATGYCAAQMGLGSWQQYGVQEDALESNLRAEAPPFVPRQWGRGYSLDRRRGTPQASRASTSSHEGTEFTELSDWDAEDAGISASIHEHSAEQSHAGSASHDYDEQEHEDDPVPLPPPPPPADVGKAEGDAPVLSPREARAAWRLRDSQVAVARRPPPAAKQTTLTSLPEDQPLLIRLNKNKKLYRRLTDRLTTYYIRTTKAMDKQAQQAQAKVAEMKAQLAAIQAMTQAVVKNKGKSSSTEHGISIHHLRKSGPQQ